jgi:hypothetical protein
LTGAKRGWRANLAEERLEELTLSGDTAQITARGAEIVTLIFEV